MPLVPPVMRASFISEVLLYTRKPLSPGSCTNVHWGERGVEGVDEVASLFLMSSRLTRFSDSAVCARKVNKSNKFFFILQIIERHRCRIVCFF